MKTSPFLLAPLLVAAAPAFAQVEVCEILSMEEVNTITAQVATKTKTLPTKDGKECQYFDAKQKSVLTLEVRGAKLPKAELDVEAENLQKIYRTSVKPVEVGDGGFWLTSKQELFFRKAKNIVRVVIAPAPDTKTTQARSETIARLVSSRLK
jgi:hypothetical protein